MMIGEKWCLFNLMEIMAFWGQNVFMSFPPAFLRLSFPSSFLKAPWINFLLFFHFSWCLSMTVCLLFLLSYGIFGFQTNWFFIYNFFLLPFLLLTLHPRDFRVERILSFFCCFFPPFCLFYVYVLFGMLRLSLDYWCPYGKIYWNQLQLNKIKICFLA